MKTTTPIIFSLGMLAALVLPHDVALWAYCFSVGWAIGGNYLWM